MEGVYWCILQTPRAIWEIQMHFQTSEPHFEHNPGLSTAWLSKNTISKGLPWGFLYLRFISVIPIQVEGYILRFRDGSMCAFVPEREFFNVFISVLLHINLLVKATFIRDCKFPGRHILL